MFYIGPNKTYGEKASRQLYKNAASNTEQVLEATAPPQSSSGMDTYHPSRKQPRLDEPDMQDTAGEVGTNS